MQQHDVWQVHSSWFYLVPIFHARARQLPVTLQMLPPRHYAFGRGGCVRGFDRRHGANVQRVSITSRHGHTSERAVSTGTYEGCIISLGHVRSAEQRLPFEKLSPVGAIVGGHHTMRVPLHGGSDSVRKPCNMSIWMVRPGPKCCVVNPSVPPMVLRGKRRVSRARTGDAVAKVYSEEVRPREPEEYESTLAVCPPRESRQILSVALIYRANVVASTARKVVLTRDEGLRHPIRGTHHGEGFVAARQRDLGRWSLWSHSYTRCILTLGSWDAERRIL